MLNVSVRTVKTGGLYSKAAVKASRRYFRSGRRVLMAGRHDAPARARRRRPTAGQRILQIFGPTTRCYRDISSDEAWAAYTHAAFLGERKSARAPLRLLLLLHGSS